VTTKLRWLGLVVALLAALFAAAAYFQIAISNPSVAHELSNNPQGERAGIVMMFTIEPGRSLPVNYLREGQTVYVGADGSWWRLFEDAPAPVSMVIRGEELTGQASVVLHDPDFTHEVFSRLRPNAPAWLPDWLNGKLVVITLDAVNR
jgi:hypothetical protein